MKIEALHIGEKVRHPQYGPGVVKAIGEHSAEIQFDNDVKRTVEPDTSGIEPAEAVATVSGLQVPLEELIREVTRSAIQAMGVEKPDDVLEGIGTRWHKGKLVLHPADPTLQTKDVPMETFFHKIVMVRNNLRVLEQKINTHPKLEEAEKIELQQYLTRCYGSLTTFNVLFKEKEDQF